MFVIKNQDTTNNKIKHSNTSAMTKGIRKYRSVECLKAKIVITL